MDKNFDASATTLQRHVSTENRIEAGRPTGKGLATRDYLVPDILGNFSLADSIFVT